MSANFFATLTELGELFDVSSHKIGRWLTEIGLRTGEKRPSRAAFDGGFVEKADNGRNGGYFYVWHREKTITALGLAGHFPTVQVKRPDQPSNPRLIGPFEVRATSDGRFEIVGSDTLVAMWVWGDRNAAKVAEVLSIAAKHGLLE